MSKSRVNTSMPLNINNALWITWGEQIRNRTLATLLGVRLVAINYDGGRVLRYLKSSLRTIKIIRESRPAVVISPNPSIVHAYLLLLLRRLYGFSLISDAHHAGMEAQNSLPFFQTLLDAFNARVDLVIVTNEEHAGYAASLGGRPFICQDPLPRLPMAANIKGDGIAKSVFFICSFDKDEPYDAALAAFKRLKEAGFSLFVSGDWKRVSLDVARYPWINFLGFIPESDFYGYLKQCSVILDLTTMENCLVCGAYEALSARKPLVVSDTNALRSYFSPAAVFTENTAEAIADSVIIAYDNREQLSLKAKAWAEENNDYMAGRIKELAKIIAALSKIKAASSKKKRTALTTK